MSVSLVGSEGFFTREGVIIGEFNRVASLYGSALTNGFQSIWQQFASSDQIAVENLPSAVSTYAQSGQNYQSTLIADGITAQLLQVNRSAPLVPYTLVQAITVVAAQMRSTSQSINRPTTGATVTPAGTNEGDTTLVSSQTNQYGDPLDMILAETVNVTCPSASGSSYQGSLQALGATVISPYLSTWPGGSGANTTFTIADGAVDGIITDGDYTDWTGSGSNDPVNWDITNGAAGVTVFRSAAGGLRSTNALQITSDGAQATQVGQEVSLAVNTVYCISVYAKISSLTATGTFRMMLCDDNGTILTDDAGTSLSYTRNVNGQIGTSYAILTAFFSTPRQLPVTTFVRYGFSVAATSGRTLSLSLANIVQATQLYAGGPFVAAVSGTLRTALNDTWTIAYTNSLTSRSFARGCDRLYNMRQLGVYYPSSGSPTIADSLVTN